MSIRKRELPSGEIRWQVDYRDQEGVRRARQFKKQKEAVDFETVARGQIRDGTHTADSASVTVAKASEHWLDRCRLDGLEPGTVRYYEQHCRLHILPLLGKTKLSRLTKPAVEAFRDKLLQTCSRAMAAKVMTSFKSLISDAHRRGLIAQNVAVKTTVKMAGRHEKRIEIPSKDEIRSLLHMAGEIWTPASPWCAFVITALFTGMRPSELRGLTWDHVDFEGRIIEIRRRADYHGKLGSPKSKAGNRDIPLSPMALNTLKQWKLACPRSELGLVFPAKRGGVIVISEVWRAWGQLLKAAGLPSLRYRFYDLRHVAASLMIEQGMQPKKVQAIMGHANIQMTYNVYGHLFASPESDQEAMAQIEARLLRSS
jgi:integrase